MSKKPRTTGEHIVALYGHIKGLSREIKIIKINHLKHMHEDIDRILYSLGAIGLLVLGQLLYLLTK